MKGYKRYRRTPVVNYPEREWPNKQIEKAPAWVSVDLRDGNQALVDPMVVSEKMEMFKLLVKLGFKEIEIGFPAASQLEYDFLRELIEKDMIPDDVIVQVLSQCREDQIEKTFESIEGCKQAVVHIYNSTSTLQRDVVFGKDRQAIIDIAVEGTKWVKERAEKSRRGLRNSPVRSILNIPPRALPARSWILPWRSAQQCRTYGSLLLRIP